MTDLEALTKRIEVLEDKFGVLHEQLTEAANTSVTRIGISTRMDHWESVFQEFNKALIKITDDIKTLMLDSKYVELFTGDQIKNWFMATDLTSRAIMDIICTHFPEREFTLQTISNYVKGNCPDVHVRSFLGKYLRNEATKQFKKSNKDNTKA